MAQEMETHCSGEAINPSPISYTTLCRLFLENTEDLFPFVLKNINDIASQTAPDSDRGKFIGKVLVGLLGNAVRGFGDSTHLQGLSLAKSFIPVAGICNHLDKRINAIHEGMANNRALYLSSVLHPVLVAQRLPFSLRTQNAATYMQKQELNGMEKLIRLTLGHQ